MLGGGSCPPCCWGRWGSGAVQCKADVCSLVIGGWIWSMSSNTARPCARQGTLLEAESWVMPVIPYPSQEAAQGWGGRPGQKKAQDSKNVGKAKHGKSMASCSSPAGSGEVNGTQPHCSRQSLHGHSMSELCHYPGAGAVSSCSSCKAEGGGGCSCRALGWERHNLAWKLSSLQGMGVSPRSHAALTREQDLNTAETISPDQLNLAALNHPQARYIQIYTRLTVYYI